MAVCRRKIDELLFICAFCIVLFLGVSKEERAIILKFAKKNTVKKPWFDKYKNVVWLKPQLMGTVRYMHETESGGMRQPVWKGLRDDK